MISRTKDPNHADASAAVAHNRAVHSGYAYELTVDGDAIEPLPTVSGLSLNTPRERCESARSRSRAAAAKHAHLQAELSSLTTESVGSGDAAESGGTSAGLGNSGDGEHGHGGSHHSGVETRGSGDSGGAGGDRGGVVLAAPPQLTSPAGSSSKSAVTLPITPGVAAISTVRALMPYSAAPLTQPRRGAAESQMTASDGACATVPSEGAARTRFEAGMEGGEARGSVDPSSSSVSTPTVPTEWLQRMDTEPQVVLAFSSAAAAIVAAATADNHAAESGAIPSTAQNGGGGGSQYAVCAAGTPRRTPRMHGTTAAAKLPPPTPGRTPLRGSGLAPGTVPTPARTPRGRENELALERRRVVAAIRRSGLQLWRLPSHTNPTVRYTCIGATEGRMRRSDRSASHHCPSSTLSGLPVHACHPPPSPTTITHRHRAPCRTILLRFSSRSPPRARLAGVGGRLDGGGAPIGYREAPPPRIYDARNLHRQLVPQAPSLSAAAHGVLPSQTSQWSPLATESSEPARRGGGRRCRS